MTKQAEKALRDAGWEETIYGDLGENEEFYLLGTGSLLVGNRGILDPEDKVLRAPRPEPEYELGTVVWGLVGLNTSGPQALIRQDDDEYPWVSVYLPYSIQGAAWRNSAVKVLRVLAYPDGSTPWIKPTGNQVDQIKVIDESGYGYVNTSARDVEYAFEDDGKTLEVFTGGTGSTHRPGDSFGKYVTDIDLASGRMDARGRELLEQLRDRLTITDDMIERAALAIAEVDEWPTNEELGGNLTGTRDDEFRDEHIDMARAALEAALGGHE